METALIDQFSPYAMACSKADRLLKEIRSKQFRQDSDDALDNIDTKNHKLRIAIADLAYAGQDISVEDVVRIDHDIHADYRNKALAQLAKNQRCHLRSESLKLFRVENRAGRNIDVAALDVDCARMFASSAGHVRDAKNAKIFVYGDDWLENQRKEGSAVWRALRAGVPGVLKTVGNHVIIESKAKVYSALSPVVTADSRFDRS
jgi:hypothetical protein